MGEVDERYTNIKSIFNYRNPVNFQNNCWINQWGWLANVSTDGNVYPNIVEIDQEQFCVGNINEQKLEVIWNSKRHKDVKEQSNKKWLSGECKNCRAISYNVIVNQYLALMPTAYDAFI